MNLSDLLSKLDGVDPQPDGWLAVCPAHDDSHPSLRVTVGDTGRVLVKDRAGCETSAVMSALGLTMGDLSTMTPDIKPDRTASAADVPAGAEDIAALAADLDRWARALTGGSNPDQVAARNYARDRFGLSDDDMSRLGLGLALGLPGGPRLAVPFRDKDGVPRGFQARALDKNASVRWLGPKNPDGTNWTKVAYFPGSTGWDEVLITEGPGDSLTGVALGYDTVGIRGAGLVSNPAVVDQVADMLGDREAVIAGDGDPAGQRFSTLLAEALVGLGKRVRILAVPDDEDLTSWREKNPATFNREVIRAIAEAKPVTSREAALLGWDEDRYALSDLGAARYLRDYLVSLGSGVKFTAEAGFLLLDNGVWRIDDRQNVRTHAQAVADIVKRLASEARDIAESSQQPDDKKRAGRMTGYAKHAQTTRGIDAMLRELQAVDGVPASLNDFDQHHDMLAVRNGVIDLRTGELKPHNPNLLITRRIDADYDPDARAPRWEQFMREVFPEDPDMPAFMQRLIGYGITGRTDEQIFCIHLGKGANGKSVFTDTLTEVFREITTTTPFSTFEAKPSGGIPNDLAALKGARMVMASEGELGKRMAEAMLKRVTGRDLISARFMRQEFFEFRPTFLLHLATNARPNFRGQDEGLWRRVKLISWKRYFKPHERDKRLSSDLLAEGEGILTWAVRGAVEWFANGLQDPATVQIDTEDYRDTSNVLDGFLPGRYIHDPDVTATVGKQIFHDFQEWADEENHRDLRDWSSRAFYGALEERGFIKRKSKEGIVFDGIRKATAADNVDRAEPDEPAIFSVETAKSTGDLSGADLDAVI